MERDESLRLRDRGDLDDEVLRVVVRGLELDEASRSRHDSSGWPGIDVRTARRGRLERAHSRPGAPCPGAELEPPWSLSWAEPTRTGVNDTARPARIAISAAQRVRVDYPGGQGVAGSNPVVPTVGQAVSSLRGCRPLLR